MKTVRTARRRLLLVGGVATCIGASLGYGLQVAAEGAPTDEPLFYAGTVSSKDGEPLDGMHAIDVSLFGAATGGPALCSASAPQAPVSLGRFRVELPSGSKGCREVVANTPNTWVELEVDGTVFPRSKVGAVPYAIEADHSKSATVVTGDQAEAITKLNATVTSLQAAVAALKPAPAPKLKARIIKFTPGGTDCIYESSSNAMVCTCAVGEIIVGAGGWSGVDGAINGAGHYDLGGDANDADRLRVWTMNCATFTNTAHLTPVQCQLVQATCLSL